MNLAVCTYATKNYLHCWPQFVRRVCAAVSHLESGHFIFSTDESKESNAAAELLKTELPENWKIHVIKHKILDDSSENYKTEAQQRIAILQGSAFAAARKLKCDYCFSVESDVLISPDSFRVLKWVLDMPSADGSPIYDIAAGTYPNAGFLLGFGTPQNQIAEDFLPSERILPKRLKKVFEECENRLKSFDYKSDNKLVKKEQKRFERISKKIRNCPPDGNIWEVIAKHGWRRRGWLDNAMPATLAQVFHADWCGLGITLLSKKALNLADFDGYVGSGTQDLFLCWNRWYPAGLKIAGVPYILADHIKKRKDKDDKCVIEHLIAFKETDGEYRGHLRVKSQNWTPL